VYEVNAWVLGIGRESMCACGSGCGREAVSVCVYVCVKRGLLCVYEVNERVLGVGRE